MYKFRKDFLCIIPGTVAPPRPSTPILPWLEVCAGSMIIFTQTQNLSPASNQPHLIAWP